MNDIIRPSGSPTQPQNPLPVTPPSTEVLPVSLLEQINPSPESPQKKPRSRKRIVLIILTVICSLIIAVLVAVFAWYELASKPVSSAANKVRVQVVKGSSPTQIGRLLEEKKIIRSQLAFDIYTRLSGARNRLQAGTYRLSPSEPMEKVVARLVSGSVDEFTLTFYPGATLTDMTDTPEDKKTDVQTVLRRAGFADEEITEAFKKLYNHPLFVGKPASTSLEGYIYGETYNFDSNATVEQILERTFDEYYNKLTENNLITGFKRQGLTLYQGITLASIVQREVPGVADQKQVAQVFLKRLRNDIPLGSDITAYYGADREGSKRSVTTDTVYNTRIHPGLPPGPIASPGLTALEAVAHPAKGDYLYFLSGDNNITYFARTDKEHEANIRDHCKIKCSIE